MNVTLLEANRDQHDTLVRNLYQFYQYEFSRLTHWPIAPSGKFEAYVEEDMRDCWEHDHLVFLIHADNELAGFALITLNEPGQFTNRLTSVMDEFFVLAAYQRKGVGEQAAVQLFNRFPGQWEVFEISENTRAQAFWRSIIGRYTNNQYREHTLPDRHGIYQTFESA